MKASVLAEPILVGRERELSELQHCLDLAVSGKGVTVFISGEAGSGKTKLIQEFLIRAKGRGITALTGWCLSNAAVPYFPFFEAFNAYFSDEQRRESDADVTEWLKGPSQTGRFGKEQTISPQVWKDQTFAAVTKTLIALSARKPVILFIDDVHWADSASLALIHYIAHAISSEKVLLLATFRSEQLTSDAEGRPHPLVETLRLMRREDLFKEIKIPALGQEGIFEVAKSMLGGLPQLELAERLAEESQGNPLFVVESLRMLNETGGLVLSGDQWRLSVDEVGIPPKIKDIVLQRLSLLLRNQRRVLEAASVIGERFEVEILGSVLGLGRFELIETLDAIAKATCFVYCVGDLYWFDHARSREAIYDEISPALKREYHAKIAETYEKIFKGSKLPLVEVAYHFAKAENSEKAIEYALAAGNDALARWSNTEAIQHFDHVLKAVGDNPEHAEERSSALEGLGDALFDIGLFDRALDMFEQLISASDSGAVKLRALRKAFACAYWIGNSGRMLELKKKVEEYVQFDRLEYGRFRLYRGFFDRTLGNMEQSFSDISGALRIFEEEFSFSDVARALGELVFSYLSEDQLEDGLASGLRSIALYQQLADMRGELWARSRFSFTLRHPELYEQALDNIEKGLRIGEKIGDYNLTAVMHLGLGLMQSLIGDSEGAIAEILKAAEIAERTSSYVTQRICYAFLVGQYARLGAVDRAEEFEKKCEKLLDKSAPYARMFLVSKACLLTADGQWREANEIFEKLMEIDDKSERGSLGNVASRNSYAWALAKQGRTEEAKKQLEKAAQLRENVTAGLERLEHANVQPYLMARREIGVSDVLPIRLDLVNVSKKPAAIFKIEGLVPLGFEVTTSPSNCRLQKGYLEMKQSKLNPLEVESVELTLESSVAGDFTLAPRVTYIDDRGETKTCTPRSVIVTVHPMLHARIGEETVSVPILPNRVATGHAELDLLLFGGIPDKFAVILTSLPNEEREKLVETFLETGVAAGETVFYATADAGNAKALAEKYPSSVFLFVCNPQAELKAENIPNVFKLDGVENLTDVDIALAKAFRFLDTSAKGSRRICIDVVSDVLLQHRAVSTRRWLSALLPKLKSKGFTILAVIDPTMHPTEETQAVLGLFDGEISIYDKETPKGTVRFLRIKKLTGQKYLKDEIPLTEE